MLFSHLLQDENTVVRQQTLQTFSEFAEQTCHESVVSESLSNDADVRERVVAYFNKVRKEIIHVVLNPKSDKCILSITFQC